MQIQYLTLDLHALSLGLHTSEAILHGASAGQLFETAAVAEWIKLFHQRGEQPTLFFWRSSAGDEVDLIIERNGRLHGLEITAPGSAPSRGTRRGERRRPRI